MLVQPIFHILQDSHPDPRSCIATRAGPVEAYSQLILPLLARGPRTQADLSAPLHALQLLEREGLIRHSNHIYYGPNCKPRMAVCYWYRADAKGCESLSQP